MNRLLITLMAALALAPAAWALPKPKLPGADAKVPSTGGGTGGGATTQDVDAFIVSALASEKMVRASSVQLGRAVLAKEKLDPLEQRRLAAEKMTEGKERDAALRKVDVDRNAELAKVDYQKVASEDASKWDEQKKTAVRDSLFNLGLGALIDVELVSSGRKLASGQPSPEVATRMPLVNDTVGALAGQADGLAKITGSAKVLATAVKLDKLPTSASETPREVKL